MLGRIAGFTSVAALLLLVACQDYGGVALTPSRQFMAARDIPPRDVAAYGVVALTAKPTTASRGRLLRLCQAYLASLPPRESLRNVPPSRQMVTIWPVENPRAILSGHERCDQTSTRTTSRCWPVGDRRRLRARRRSVRAWTVLDRPVAFQQPRSSGCGRACHRHVPLRIAGEL